MNAVKVGHIWVDMDELRETTDLTQVYGAGKRICPWHNDTIPSLHVYPDHVYCYACGHYASAVAYVREEEGLGFEDAVKFLLAHKSSSRVRVEIDTSPVDISLVYSEHQELLGKSLFSPAWRWLSDRGIEESTVKSLTLGWTGRAYSIPHWANGNVYNIKYRIHPIYQREGEPKYNSMPGRGFMHLYPWDYFRKTFSTAPAVFMTEGEFDCMLLLQAGLPALSTPSGANTPWTYWVPFLKQFKYVFVLYDQDAAGTEAAERLVNERGHINKTVQDLLQPAVLRRIVWNADMYGKDVTEARHMLLPKLASLYRQVESEVNSD